MRFTKSVTFLLTFLTFIFAQTANLSLTNYDADSGSFDIYMVNDEPVGGFQFNVSGFSSFSTSGGSAADAGFTVQPGGNTILGFSFSGATIPVGEGALLTINGEFDGSDICLLSPVISDPFGSDIFDGDPEICLASPDYTVNSGSFYYTPAELTVEIGETVEWINDGGLHDVVVTSGPVLFSLPACSGPCTIGSYTFEEPGTYDYICSIGSHASQGMVGTIIVNSPALPGCTDVSACNYNSLATEDDGSCIFAEENFDCDGNCVVDIDCAGVCNGDAILDCAGICGGNAVVDICGVCDGPGFTTCWDGSEVCDEATCPAQPSVTVDVLYDSYAPIGGFQFNIESGTLVSASGGAAADAGFTLSTSPSVVIAFSLTGATIPAGSGTLVTLEIEGADSTCISDLVISDPIGSPIDYSLDCNSFTTLQVLEGCTDASACNYDENANTDDGSCTFAEENFDCDGNCVVDIDCADVCGGSSELDDCGVCDGPGFTTCWDGSEVCDEATCPAVPTYTVDVLFDSHIDIGGFQFGVSNGSILSASGGAAADAGFSVSASTAAVIGFSLTGSIIPAGTGTLVSVDIEATEQPCITDLIISDGFANPVDYSLNCSSFSTIPPGCTDVSACNYDESALTDDGSCEYPETNFDCDGNCVVDTDCAGICGGTSVEDCAGVCNGTSSEVTFCEDTDGDGLGNPGTEVVECVDLGSRDVNSGCDLPENNLYLSEDGFVFYNTNQAIGGFQFTVDGSTVNGGGGGDSATAGFTVQPGGSLVLGFSFSGSTVPVGCGTLVELDLNPGATSLSDIVISDAIGGQIPFEYYYGENEADLVADCSDSYPDCTSNIVDCAGECDGLALEDCAGVCNGESVLDECGVCGGDGIADGECDCDGNVDLGCGCGEDGPSGCDQTCGSDLEFDECGVCGGDDSSCAVSLTFGNVTENLMEILVETGNTSIAGFQFNISGTELISATNGLAVDNGFTVSVGLSTVIGFSLAGSTIPENTSGLLTLLAYNSTDFEACIEGVVISDADGVQLPSIVGSCTDLDYVISGCTDSQACNYNSEATEDDGSCIFAEENFDCDGNCLAFDDCGECGGDGSSCTVSLSFGSVTSDSMEILYNSPLSIGGFQFGIASLAEVTSASGGAAADAGFTLSTSPSLVIGFSLTGSTIEAGSGVLTNLSYICDYAGLNEACITDIVVSDPLGAELASQFSGDCAQVGDEAISGCTDASACNYDENANTDDGSCTFAEENFDCDGNCVVDVDCNGDCGGDAAEDCAGVCSGDATEDQCGVCQGDNSTCSGCTDELANNFDSDATIDDGSCNFDHFYTSIQNTGVSQSIIFSETISILDIGDEIGIFDANALISNGDCSSEYGNLLVGNGIWSGEQLNATAISSIDFCGFPDGYQLSGFVEGNPIVIKLWDASESMEYDVTFETTAGIPDFEETSFVVISELEIVVSGCTDASACNYDENANTNDGSCTFPEDNFDCDGNCVVDVDCNGDCGGDAYVDDCGDCVVGDSACSSEATNTINLASNWNWISFNVNPGDMSLSNVFSSVAIANDGIDNVNFIKSQLDGTSTWYETFGWFGALETIDNSKMYQVLMNNPATLTFTGTPVTPSENPIDLATNWNWIGFLPQNPTPIATALGSIAIANDGIDNVNFIKSQLDGTSTWYETFGWFGALEVLQPTKGYQLLMNNPATLFYPDDSSLASLDLNYENELNRSSNIESLSSDFNPREYEFNGTITLSVENFEDNEGDILSAYIDGELRGITECVYFPYGDKNIYIIQVYSNELSGEEIQFELYHNQTGEIYKYNETVVFENDMVLGDGFATLVLSDLETDNIVPSENSLGMAYPNPFNPTTNFEYNITSDTFVSVVVYDISGQVVETLVDNYMTAGIHNISWNANNYPSGIYFLGMNVNGEFYSQKLMLVK